MYFNVVNHLYFSLECREFFNRGFNMKIFPLSDPILLPLAPAITRTIADYLQSITQEHYLNSLNQNRASIVTELPQDLSWQWQCQRSIRQISIPQYQYVSTIAHQLAAKLALTPLEMCQNLDIPLPALTVEAQSSRLKLECWCNPGGYIYCQLSDEAISTWLNYIHDLPLQQLDSPEERLRQRDNISSFSERLMELPSGKIDLARYAHARCCSLLRLADGAKLVTISASWQLSQSPWLQDLLHQENRLTGRLNPIFEHPVEQRLMQVLMTVIDAIYGHNCLSGSADFESDRQNLTEISHRSPKSPNWVKLTLDLAQGWLEFHRHCQVFGDLKSHNPHLAIARCGLTAISRRYLELLLTKYLGVDAPIRL
jgi:hypothetical protein